MRSALSQMAKLEVFEEEREGTTVYAYVLNDTMLGMIVMINGWKVEAVCPTTFVHWQDGLMWKRWWRSRFPGILHLEKECLATFIGDQRAYYFTAFNEMDLPELQKACLQHLSMYFQT